MNHNQNHRRQFIKNAGTGLGLLTLSSLLNAQRDNKITPGKIVCIGGHPDDPESGCGGTLIKLAQKGNSITIIYLTAGEAGIVNKSYNEAAFVRKQEAVAACKILNATPLFAGQIDGSTIVNSEWIDKMKSLIDGEKPDMVFTHWPVDSHKDHQAASLLTVQAWVNSKSKWPLYFYEVCTGEQTMMFHPTDYANITDTQEQKRKALFCHTSQNPQSIYDCGHTAMEGFRGREIGVRAAEAFVRINGKEIFG